MRYQIWYNPVCNFKYLLCFLLFNFECQPLDQHHGSRALTCSSIRRRGKSCHILVTVDSG